MKDYIETKHGKAYFKHNPHHGDKLEISSWLKVIREQLASCINTWHRSANYDELHENLYFETLKELRELQKTTSKVEKLLMDYLLKKS